LTAKKNSPLPFETALAEWDTLVGQPEPDELTPEDSLQRFERSVVLVRSGQNARREMEQTVEPLIERNGRPDVTSFGALLR